MARRGRRRSPRGYLAIRDGRPVALLVREVRRRKRNIGIDREFARAVDRLPKDFSRALARTLAGRR